MRYSINQLDEYTALRLTGTVRKLEPLGVTVPRKILEAVTHAEERIPALERQRRELQALIGDTGSGFIAGIASDELSNADIITRLVSSDLSHTQTDNAIRGAKVHIGRTLRTALKDHGEKWISALRTVIEERADMVYSGVYDPDSLDPKRDPRGAEYALRDDATALAWGELTTLWSVVSVFHSYGVLPHHGRRADAYLFSTPTEVRGEKDHHDFTRFIVMCREEHEPSLYTEQEVQQFEAEHAERGAPALPRDRYTAAGFQRGY
jgi:hypothetical protein